MNGILIFFHCPSNTGYAIGTLEETFFQMAMTLLKGNYEKIHFAYTDISSGAPKTLPSNFKNIIEFDSTSRDPKAGKKIQQYLQNNGIDVAFGFDQRVYEPSYRFLRKGGIKKFISYWGAPISGINHGLKLWLKRLQVALTPYKPDHYVFESNGMARTATLGRGIPAKNVSTIYIGIDTDRFKPNPAQKSYVYDAFSIPKNRKIFFYSGHMEERKGVHILIKAAEKIISSGNGADFHLLITGNRAGEETPFLTMLSDSKALNHVTFGGYRNDIPLLHGGCYAGLIASTGWDSLTCSALEITSSGLPLITSNLEGLQETVVDGITGFTFPAGDVDALASRIIQLMDNPKLTEKLGIAARQRATEQFSVEFQRSQLVKAVNKLLSNQSLAD